MDSEKFKRELFNKFKNSNINLELNGLLRKKITENIKFTNKIDNKNWDFTSKIVLSLIFNFLKNNSFNQTLAAFSGELTNINIMNISDIFNFLENQLTNRKWLNIFNNNNNKVLYNIIEYIFKIYKEDNKEIQTNNISLDNDLNSQLKFIEQQHLLRNQNNKETITSIKNMLEKDYKNRYTEEIKYFKDTEIEKIRLNFQNEFEIKCNEYKNLVDENLNKIINTYKINENNLIKEFEFKVKELELKEKLINNNFIKNNQINDKLNDYNKNSILTKENYLKSKEILLIDKEKDLDKGIKELKEKQNSLEQLIYNEVENLKNLELKEIIYKKKLLNDKISEYDSSISQITGLKSKINEFSLKNNTLIKDNSELQIKCDDYLKLKIKCDENFKDIEKQNIDLKNEIFEVKQKLYHYNLELNRINEENKNHRLYKKEFEVLIQSKNKTNQELIKDYELKLSKKDEIIKLLNNDLFKKDNENFELKNVEFGKKLDNFKSKNCEIDEEINDFNNKIDLNRANRENNLESIDDSIDI